MKIIIIGATGRVGSEVLIRSLQGGHIATAYVRAPEKLKLVHEKLLIYHGNVMSKSDLLQAMSEADAVICTLSTNGTNILSKGIPLIIEIMKIHRIKRIITIGTAGILQSSIDPNRLRYQTIESRRKSTQAAEEHHKAYNILKQSGLDWTIVCPTFLTEEQYTGYYRTERDFLPLDGKKISIEDTGEFTYNQIKSTAYIKSRVGIAY